MLMKLSTWSGININDWNGSTGSFEASIPPAANVMPSATPEFAGMGENNAVLSGISISGTAFTFLIAMHGALHTAMNTLATIFRVDVPVSASLVALDTADSNRSWYLTGRVIQPPTLLGEDRPSTVSVVIALDAPYWQESVLQTDTWSITASGQTRAITPRGNLPTNPVYKFAPTSAPADQFAFKRYAIVYNQTAYAFDNYPISLTGTGVGHAALVSGGKALANGYDWRVFVDGRDTNRWNYGLNTTGLRTWITQSLKPKVELTLSVSIASGAGLPAVIQFSKTLAANKRAIRRLPARGKLLIDSEIFFYTSISKAKFQVVPSERGSRGTSTAAHSIGAVARFIEHDNWIIYGNSTAAAPVTNDLVKPAIEIDVNSHNTQWSYDSCFWDQAGTRRGKWTRAVIAGVAQGQCAVLTATHETVADPASEPGIRLKAYKLASGWRAANGQAEVKLIHPAGITNVTAALDRWRTGAKWPDTEIQKSLNGTTWVTVSDVTTPAAGAWTAFSLGSTALGATYRYLRLRVLGPTAATASAKTVTQLNSMTIALDAATVPSVTLLAEQSDYYMDITLENAANAYDMGIRCIMALGVTTVADCENLTCTAGDGAGIAVELNTNREEWLPLEAGISNTLTYTSVGLTSGLTLTTEYRARNTL